ncbi:MAG TPA: hypothetical protein VF776_03550 [Sphingomicrobium sp.]
MAWHQGCDFASLGREVLISLGDLERFAQIARATRTFEEPLSEATIEQIRRKGRRAQVTGIAGYSKINRVRGTD